MQKTVRNRRISVWLNEDEFKALDRYLIDMESKKRSDHIRKILMRHILTQLEENYPTLFSENDMRR